MTYIKDRGQYEYYMRLLSRKHRELEQAKGDSKEESELLKQIADIEKLANALIIEDDEESFMNKVHTSKEVWETIRTFITVAVPIIGTIAVAVITAHGNEECARINAEARCNMMHDLMDYEKNHDDFIAGHEVDVVNKINK